MHRYAADTNSDRLPARRITKVGKVLERTLRGKLSKVWSPHIGIKVVRQAVLHGYYRSAMRLDAGHIADAFRHPHEAQSLIHFPQPVGPGISEIAVALVFQLIIHGTQSFQLRSNAG